MNDKLTSIIGWFTFIGMLSFTSIVNIFVGSFCHESNNEHIYIVFSVVVEFIMLVIILIKIGEKGC